MPKRKLRGYSNIPAYWEPNIFILFAFLVFVLAKYMQWADRRDIFATMRIEFVLGIVLAIICIGIIQTQPLNLRSANSVLFAIVGLFVTMIIQIPFAASTDTAKNIFIDRVIKFSMLSFFMMVLIQSPRYLRYFIFTFLLACFYITQESVQGLLSGSLYWENQGVMRLHGAVNIYAHPNSLGGVAMGTVPFVIFLFPVWRNWLIRAGLLAVISTSVICVLYSGSRTAYVAFISFIFYWWLMSRRKLMWMTCAIILGVVVIQILPDQYKGRFMSIGGQETEGHSKDKRVQILKDAWQIFLENPGGVGVGCFPIVRMQRFGRIQNTHNLYLEVATNLGVQGFVVFIILVTAMLNAYRKAYQAFKRQLKEIGFYLNNKSVPLSLRRQLRIHTDDLELLMACCIATGGFIFVRLVLGLFGMDLYEVYWWFSAGMAITLLSMVAKTAANTRKLLAACTEDKDIMVDYVPHSRHKVIKSEM